LFKKRNEPMWTVASFKHLQQLLNTRSVLHKQSVSLWSCLCTLHLSHQIFLWIYAWWNLYKWEVIPVCNLRTPVSVSSQMHWNSYFTATKLFWFHCRCHTSAMICCKWGMLDIWKKTSWNINRTLQKNYYTWWILLHTYIYIYIFIHRTIICTIRIKCWIHHEKR